MKITAIKLLLLSKYNQQVQTTNKFLPLKEAIEDMSEAENGDQEELYSNDNIQSR